MEERGGGRIESHARARFMGYASFFPSLPGANGAFFPFPFFFGYVL